MFDWRGSRLTADLLFRKTEIRRVSSQLRITSTAGDPSFPIRRKGWEAFDFFHRYPQPGSIALGVSPCHATSGGLPDDGRNKTCEGSA